MPGLSGPAGDELHELLRKCDQALSQSGRLRIQSGILPWSEGMLTVHTDYGPPQQDKDTNQDYVLAWCGGNTQRPTGVQWAVAMADGVTSSYWAEIGAKLACHTSLQQKFSPPPLAPIEPALPPMRLEMPSAAWRTSSPRPVICIVPRENSTPPGGISCAKVYCFKPLSLWLGKRTT